MTVEQLTTINGKVLLRAIYRDSSNAKSSSHVYAAAFLLQVGNSLRPFFVIFPDEELEEFDSDLTAVDGKPLRLTLTTSMSGSGHYHSIYEFTFPEGRPQFEGRRDTGRHIEEPEVVK